MPRHGAFYTPYFPRFGNGAPGVNVDRALPYFDQTTNPFTAYIYRAGAWHAYGAVGTIDAHSIQGVPVDATPPTNGQKLIYNGGSGHYAPA